MPSLRAERATRRIHRHRPSHLRRVPLLDADTLADLIAAHSSESAAATVLTTTLPDPTGYGRILRTQDREVIGIVEQADASPSQLAITEVNAGVYAFDITALRSALSRLSPTTRSRSST